jgi:hypothetical protein
MSLRFGETLKNLAEITGIAFFQSKAKISWLLYFHSLVFSIRHAAITYNQSV